MNGAVGTQLSRRHYDGSLMDVQTLDAENQTALEAKMTTRDLFHWTVYFAAAAVLLFAVCWVVQ